MEKDAMEETTIDNSKPLSDSCTMQRHDQWQKEVKTTGLVFVKRGIAMVVFLLVAALVIACTTAYKWVWVPAVVSALYTLAVVVATGLLWIRVANRSVDSLTTFYSAVPGFRMLLTLATMFGYYLACGREEMLGFLLVLAPFYVAMLVHHSIFFGMKSKIVDKFNNVKQHS